MFTFTLEISSPARGGDKACSGTYLRAPYSVCALRAVPCLIGDLPVGGWML